MAAMAHRPVLVAAAALGPGLGPSATAAAIGRGIERAGLGPPDLCPLSHGGVGTIEVLLPALGGETTAAEGAPYALLEGGGTALVQAGERSADAILGAARGGAAVIVVAAAHAPPGTEVVAAVRAGGGLGVARLVALAGRDGGGLAAELADGLGAVLEPGARWVLDELGFDARMLAARAVVLAVEQLGPPPLLGTLLGEVGTRCRQAGVPLHAVTAERDLDDFGARIVDLQHIVEAPSLAEAEAAGERIGAAL